MPRRREPRLHRHPHALAEPETGGARRVAVLTAVLDASVLNYAPTPMFFAGSCEISLTALPQSGATVRLHLDAPCYVRQRITVSHAGLEFADVTGTDGSFSMDFPALNEFAPFVVSFVDGASAEAKTLKLSPADYVRIAVSWAGAPVLRIHAMEYGARFGDTGYVWAKAANNATRVGGGFWVQLGNPNIPSPKLAEIYTFNTGEAAKDGSIEFRVKAAVTAQTCARDINGRSFQLAGDGP